MNYKMNKHESRKLRYGEEYCYYYRDRVILKNNYYVGELYAIYVDSNNFLHSFNGFADEIWDSYWIHGTEYKNKNEWELAKNRLLMLEEL